MTTTNLAEPPWRIKSRPCPFYYSKAGCVFGEKCNFIHPEDGIEPPMSFPIAKSLSRDSSAESSSSSGTASGDSSNSLENTSNDSSNTSHSERSAKLENLLLALGDAISSDEEGDDEDDDEDDDEHEDTSGLAQSSFEDLSRLQFPIPPGAEPQVLSPVAMSAPLRSLSIPPTRHGSFSSSGFPEPTNPFLLSPPARPTSRNSIFDLPPLRPPSTLGLLSSPFGSPTRRVLQSFASSPSASPVKMAYDLSKTLGSHESWSRRYSAEVDSAVGSPSGDAEGSDSGSEGEDGSQEGAHDDVQLDALKDGEERQNSTPTSPHTTAYDSISPPPAASPLTAQGVSPQYFSSTLPTKRGLQRTLSQLTISAETASSSSSDSSLLFDTSMASISLRPDERENDEDATIRLGDPSFSPESSRLTRSNESVTELLGEYAEPSPFPFGSLKVALQAIPPVVSQEAENSKRSSTIPHPAHLWRTSIQSTSLPSSRSSVHLESIRRFSMQIEDLARSSLDSLDLEALKGPLPSVFVESPTAELNPSPRPISQAESDSGKATDGTESPPPRSATPSDLGPEWTLDAEGEDAPGQDATTPQKPPVRPPQSTPKAIVRARSATSSTMFSLPVGERVFSPPPPPMMATSQSENAKDDIRRADEIRISNLERTPTPASEGKVPFGFRSSSANSQRRRSNMSSKIRPPMQIDTQLASSSAASTSSITSGSGPLVRNSLKPLRLTSALKSPTSTVSWSSSFPSAPNSRSGSPMPSSAASSNFPGSASMARAASNNIAFDSQSLPLSRRTSIASTSTSSTSYSLSKSNLLSSNRMSLIPSHVRETLVPVVPPLPDLDTFMLDSDPFARDLSPFDPPPSARSIASSWKEPEDDDDSFRPSSRASEPARRRPSSLKKSRREMDRRSVVTVPSPSPALTEPMSNPAASRRPSQLAFSSPTRTGTPRPTLMFAIASDSVEEVQRVLEGGDVDPSDETGTPQGALEFAVTSDSLVNKLEIVKTLLAYGADTHSLPIPEEILDDTDAWPRRFDHYDPAVRYYLHRASTMLSKSMAAHVERSKKFAPLARARFDFIGQDRALEQMFRALGMQGKVGGPTVMLLCGPSGHGKSLLARKFGQHLGAPTHTINMTTLRSTHDLWLARSMEPAEGSEAATLADFLREHEGKRCVVILDELEKTEDEKLLWSLLPAWELGRCVMESGGRYVNVKNVVWLGTSNIGTELVFEHDAARATRDQILSREEYVELMGLLRPQVSERLGASLLSRVTTVLPFVPFTGGERLAIATEALHTLAGEDIQCMTNADIERLARDVLDGYVHTEGARSLYRAVSAKLMDGI